MLVGSEQRCTDSTGKPQSDRGAHPVATRSTFIPVAIRSDVTTAVSTTIFTCRRRRRCCCRNLPSHSQPWRCCRDPRIRSYPACRITEGKRMNRNKANGGSWLLYGRQWKLGCPGVGFPTSRGHRNILRMSCNRADGFSVSTHGSQEGLRFHAARIEQNTRKG